MVDSVRFRWALSRTLARLLAVVAFTVTEPEPLPARRLLRAPEKRLGMVKQTEIGTVKNSRPMVWRSNMEDASCKTKYMCISRACRHFWKNPEAEAVGIKPYISVTWFSAVQDMRLPGIVLFSAVPFCVLWAIETCDMWQKPSSSPRMQSQNVERPSPKKQHKTTTCPTCYKSVSWTISTKAVRTSEVKQPSAEPSAANHPRRSRTSTLVQQRPSCLLGLWLTHFSLHPRGLLVPVSRHQSGPRSQKGWRWRGCSSRNHWNLNIFEESCGWHS